jgi:hypothetical protein
VHYKQRYFAVEIQGSYVRNGPQGKEQPGKRKIREEILMHYGVPTVLIQVDLPNVKAMIKFGKFKEAANYVI